MRVHAENVVLEVLDEADLPCESGATGRVVLTVLHNFLTPFLRYDIGDYVTLAPRPCRCGLGLPLLTQVLGKQRPLFRLPDGRLKHSSGLVHSLSAVGGHYQHQAIQKSADYIVIRVVPNKAWTSNHPQRLREAVVAFFESAIRVDVEITERLELPPQRAGE